MLFLLSFAVSIWVLTSFQTLGWLLVFLFLGLMLVLCLLFLRKGTWKKITKNLIMIGGAIVLAFGAVCCYWRREAPGLFSDFWTLSLQTKVFPQQVSQELGEFVVLEQRSIGRYVVKSLKDSKNWILKSEEKLQIGKKYLMGVVQRPLEYSLTYGGRFLGTGEWGIFDQISNFLSYEFSYEKWLLMKGYAGSLSMRFFVSLDEEHVFSRFQHMLLAIRSWVRMQIREVFPGQEGGLLLGMLIGERSGLSDEVYQRFVESGIVHIIAVSGGNLVMVVVFLGALLFWVPFYVRNAIIILGVGLFAAVAGADSSVIRALIMTILSLLALFWGREVQIWRLMAYAFVIMLCINPYFLAYDLGFLLSFGALIGIVLLNAYCVPNQEDKKKKEIRLGVWGIISEKLMIFYSQFVRQYLVPTLGATLGTLPILLFFIGQTNVMGVFINLLIVPFVPMMTIGGMMTIGLVEVTGWGWFALPIQWLLNWVFLLSEWAIRYAVIVRIEQVWAKWIFSLLMFGIFLYLWKMIIKRRESDVGFEKG